MKELLVIRHAKSSWDNPGLSDKERPLNKRGLRDAPRMAAYLDKMDLKPHLLVSSQALRAKTTAGYFKQHFGDDLALDIDFDLYFGTTTEYIDVVQSLNDDFARVAIFGHNPMITDFVNNFSARYIDNVPTCGISYLVSEADTWSAFNPDNTKLNGLYFPKVVL